MSEKETKKTQKAIGQQTEAQIKSWKEEHQTKVLEVFIPIGDEDDLESESREAAFYLIRPDRNTVNSVTKHTNDKNFPRANAIMMKNCVLGGAMELLKSAEEGGDDDIYYTVLNEIGKLVKNKETRVKKH